MGKDYEKKVSKKKLYKSIDASEKSFDEKHEICMSFDLVRKKMVLEVNKGVHTEVTETDRLLPKPGAQLVPGILEQNSGY